MVTPQEDESELSVQRTQSAGKFGINQFLEIISLRFFFL